MGKMGGSAPFFVSRKLQVLSWIGGRYLMLTGGK